MSSFDTVLPVAPMFHANAWGLPFACTMLGARLVLPGPNVDPESVLGLMVSEHVTIACGVPTVWIAVLDALEKNPGRWKFDNPIRVILWRHGAASRTDPPARSFSNLHIKHLWGMTETTSRRHFRRTFGPICATCPKKRNTKSARNRAGRLPSLKFV